MEAIPAHEAKMKSPTTRQKSGKEEKLPNIKANVQTAKQISEQNKRRIN